MTTTGCDQNYLNTREIDWPAVERATYEVCQSIRYEYPGPIEDLRQMLILIPRDEVGGQRLVHHTLTVNPESRPRYSTDRFGNRVCHIAIPFVAGSLEFALSMRLERRPSIHVPMSAPDEAALYTVDSPLTEPSPALHAAAKELALTRDDPTLLAERINGWVYRHLTYTQDVTGVGTTADDALRLGRGVCQDYAHLMIALCRLSGLPARYVSGHLLGEGAMHAWVEVLVPAGDGPDAPPAWQPFDPTHGRRAGMTYITVAVGRDYGDISPTRGTFRAPYAGHLAGGSKQAGVLSVAYR